MFNFLKSKLLLWNSLHRYNRRLSSQLIIWANYRHKKASFSLFWITLISMYSALIFALQVALAPIPNVNVVAFLVLFAGISFPLSSSLTIVVTFCTLEGLMYGFADWTLTYYFVYGLLVVISFALRRLIFKKWWSSIVITGVFGYVFGTMFVPLHLAFYGLSGALAWWIANFEFDAVHGTANIIITAILFKPMAKVFKNLSHSYPILKISFQGKERK